MPTCVMTTAELLVTVDILDRVYETGRRVTQDMKSSLRVVETGRRVTQDMKSSLRVVADALLHVWNYTVMPN